MNIEGNTSLGLDGYYKVAVIDKDDNVVYEQPELKHNLILNNGMDQLVVRSLCGIWEYAISGVGTRENSLPSSGSTAYVSESFLLLTGSGTFTNFTASTTGYSSSAEVGDVIKFDDDNGTEVTVTTIMGFDRLGVSPSASVASGSFTIWKTSQTKLHNEIRRTNTYLTTGCGSRTSGSSALMYSSNLWNASANTASHFRTFDFAYETSSVDIAEVGLAWYPRFGGSYGSSTIEKTTFSRMKLPTTVSLVSGQKLRLFYTLNVTWTPITPVSLSAVVNGGWPVSPSTNTSASQMIQKIWYDSYGTRFPQFSFITPTNGNTYAANGANGIEPYAGSQGAPSNYPTFFISNVGTPLATYGTGSNRTAVVAYANSVWRSPYVTGSYTIVKTAWWNEAAFPRNDIRSAGWSYGAADSNTQNFVMVFDQNQTKTDTQTLTLSWRHNWRRTLSN